MVPVILAANPKANYLAHQREIQAAMAGVLESGTYILGKQVEAFEREFAQYIGVVHAVGLASGTDALHLALRACGIGSGDAVITVSHTAVATVAAVEMSGATPVLLDIDSETFNLDVGHLERVVLQPIGLRLRAIVPVHLYGRPAEMTAIMETAQRHGLFVIEDCAQAHGAALNGRRLGSFGHMGAFSFYPTKNLGGLGDGGAVTTNDAALAERVRLLRQYGWDKHRCSSSPGFNSRLDELQSAVLRVKLRHLDEENARRRVLAARYTSLLRGTAVLVPEERVNEQHVYHQYVVRVRRRDAARAHLSSKGIGTLIHYPVPVHLQPAYRGRIPLVGALPKTEEVAAQVISLPIYPELTTKAVEEVATEIAEWCRKHAAALGN